MTVLDEHVMDLNIALHKVMSWPYKHERDRVLDELIRYLASVRENSRAPFTAGSEEK